MQTWRRINQNTGITSLYGFESYGFLFPTLALQKFPQLPAVCGYEIFFQWTGLELHHDIVIIGGNQAAAALKVCEDVYKRQHQHRP